MDYLEETSDKDKKEVTTYTSKALISIIIISVLIIISILTLIFSIIVYNKVTSSSAIIVTRLPRIGLPGKRTGISENYNDILDYRFSEMINDIGGVPFSLPVHSVVNPVVIAEQIDAIDGLVIQGGNDVHPSLYGETNVSGLTETSDLPSDLYTIALIKAAINKGIPVLGISGGLQILNVAYGGTLWQDIPTQTGSNIHRPGGDQCGNSGNVFHSVSIVQGTILSSLFAGMTSILTNTIHHQGIKNLSSSFKTNGIANDGIIEAIEKIGSPWVLGVQWRPERMIPCNSTMKIIFTEFLNQVKRVIQ